MSTLTHLIGKDSSVLAHLAREAFPPSPLPLPHLETLRNLRKVRADLWKTQGPKEVIERHGFNAAIGGARRDQKRSRAKERIFSFRTARPHWGPSASMERKKQEGYS